MFVYPVYLSLEFHQGAAASGDGAFHQDLIVFSVYLYHFQILYRDAIAAHAAGHAHAFDDALDAGSADGARFALGMLLAVRARPAFEAVALHHSLEAFSFRNG